MDDTELQCEIRCHYLFTIKRIQSYKHWDDPSEELEIGLKDALHDFILDWEAENKKERK